MAIINFATEVMADGPIGFWRLGETQGSLTAADASMKGNDGTCSGGITFGLPGFHGGDTAALFDGATGRIVVPNSESLNPAKITMEAKVRWDGPNGFLQRILEKSSYEERAEYGLNIDKDGKVFVDLRVKAALNQADVNVSATSKDPVLLGRETHIVATYDGKYIKIYLNGNLNLKFDVGDHAGDLLLKFPSPPPPALDGYLGIGNQTYLTRNRPFNGLIDEVALYPTALSAERILAHYQSQFAEQVMIQYAAKFVCGKSAGEVVAPGLYFTAVNVHNPTYTDIRFRLKIAVALPGLTPGPVSKFYDAALGPDEALEIDSPDIFKLAETDADFLKGFVVIESDIELDVVVVYTAAGRDGQVETLHTERVPARRLAVSLPDLIAVPDEKGSFCTGDNLTLTVTVKNQGTGWAGPSVTEVDFLAFGKVYMPTPPLGPGASVDLLVPIPPGSFDPNCEFRITVDANNQVVESNKGNNIADGECRG